jgi:hypothetical protein
MWEKRVIEKMFYDEKDSCFENIYYYILDGFEFIRIHKSEKEWCGIVNSIYYRDKNGQWAVTKGEVITANNLDELKILCLIKAKELGWNVTSIKV